MLTSTQVASARAAHADLPFVKLVDFPIDRNAVSLVPAILCRRHDLLPIAISSDTITVAVSNPGDVFALEDVRAATKMRVNAVVAESRDLHDAMNRLLRADRELIDLTAAIKGESGTPAEVTGANPEVLEENVPIVRLVNLLISQAIQDRASDIHLEPAEHEMRVRYRIDGVLHEMHPAPKQIQNGVISRLKIMSDMDIAERRKPQDGRLSVSHGGRNVDLRVATLPTVWGEKMVMRILDNSGRSLNLDDLGLLQRNFDVYKKSYTKPCGMILVTGPTGCGKSTTLYATLNSVAKPEINVITVEDPVEYRLAGINQVQVNPKAGLTFASALRSILRSDPDVVLVGEIRDYETAQIAIEASLTGHLVLSTLHTNDAPSAIARLTEMNVEPFLVGSALDAVVAQRLARRLCEYCKQIFQPNLSQMAVLGFFLDPERPDPAFYQPIGCTVCANTGYRGRIAVHEIMEVSEEIGRMAVRRVSNAEIKSVAEAEGMITLREDGWAKVQLGLTSVEEILRVVT
ncbi:type IV pilus assembly protein PilB [Frigoribacterium sp. CG_9.8]|nr:type IV pilus assembly protein PilB [Frigoribacterium sp. CG_9.8]